ncbi:MAG TPA: nucleotide exchange factor GrpE [Thermoplasmataceae archaeon]|nr:nucleotide exchange factor GrpE [Thermoplasmataceae archaeon]
MSSQENSVFNITNPISSDIRRAGERQLMTVKWKEKQLTAEVMSLQEKLNEFKDIYLRQRAEMENYVKVKEREMQLITKNASRDVIKNLLPLLDALDSAIAKSDDAGNLKALRELAISSLEKYGLKVIESSGQKFDPYLHEVISVVNSDKDGIVIEEFQKGYKLNDEVIRTSKVVVGRKGD